MNREQAITEAVRRVRGRAWDYRPKPYLRWVKAPENIISDVRAEMVNADFERWMADRVVCGNGKRLFAGYLCVPGARVGCRHVKQDAEGLILSDWAKTWRGGRG